MQYVCILHLLFTKTPLVEWWKGEQEEEENTRQKLEQTAQIFEVEWINIKKGWKGWGIESRNDEKEIKELRQPKSEEIIASVQQEDNIDILTRWVPKINSEGKRKPVTRLKKGETHKIPRSMASRGNK